MGEMAVWRWMKIKDGAGGSKRMKGVQDMKMMVKKGDRVSGFQAEKRERRRLRARGMHVGFWRVYLM